MNSQEAPCPDEDFYSVLFDEFELENEMERLAQHGYKGVAEILEKMMEVLAARPPDWNAAKEQAWALADAGYGVGAQLEHFRHDLHRALLPLLWHLPDTIEAMQVALVDPQSPGAQAIGAAGVARIFAQEFQAV